MGVSVPTSASPLAMSPSDNAANPNANGTANAAGLDNKQQQPRWRPDAASDSCLCCGKGFSIWTRRRHHCRACGELVCGECSPFSGPIPELGYAESVRVCKGCKSSGTLSSSPMMTTDGSSSESSDNEMGDIDDELVFHAVDIIASNSTHKHSKLSYQYFVQSEAVSWLVDAKFMKNRSSCASLFMRLIDEGYITVKRVGSKHSTCYVLSEDVCLEQRLSHYASAMHAETNKCNNCSIAYIASMTPAKGFCSIDCKTNALINQADSARIRQFIH